MRAEEARRRTVKAQEEERERREREWEEAKQRKAEFRRQGLADGRPGGKIYEEVMAKVANAGASNEAGWYSSAGFGHDYTGTQVAWQDAVVENLKKYLTQEGYNVTDKSGTEDNHPVGSDPLFWNSYKSRWVSVKVTW